ncbi:MAG: alpha/beta hydrolase [Actinomycetota bacterium]
MSWEPDVLGAGFEARTLPLLDDEEGQVVATLVRHRPADDPGALPGTPATPSFAVLYLHGWNDYFHQRELARELAAMGAAFYGLDLRKYGRSLREHQRPGYVESLYTYDEDLHVALDVVRKEQGVGTDLVLMGHSTGGLTAALWAHRHPGALRALVLNAPWLALQGSQLLRSAGPLLVDTLARRIPTSVIPLGDPGFYFRVLHGWNEEEDGPRPEGTEGDPFYDGWSTNDAWRTSPSMPVRPGWLNAILDGHAQVADGLTITCPILVTSSTRTMISTRWSPELRSVDTVLDVEQIARRSTRLGQLVTIARFEDAIHDVFLSAAPVRGRAYAELRRWTGAYVRR